MTLVFALVGLIGITLLLIGLLCSTSLKTGRSDRWAVVFFIGLILMVLGWTGGLAIQDIEAEAAQQEYQYEYNYCPHCGEQLKGE